MSSGDEKLPLYDLEKVYDEQVAPLMSKIIEICKEHKMPMVASFQYQVDEERGPGFCTTIMVDGPDSKEVRFPTAEKLWKAAEVLKPQKPFAFAEWESTDADGKKTIHIKRML
jgi:hypothetical protein